MKGIFGLVGLLLSLAIVGLLVKKQLGTTQQIVPALQVPAAISADGVASAPTGTVKEQAQQVQDQVKQALDAAAQKSRAELDEK
jgi:hypothetical protein